MPFKRLKLLILDQKKNFCRDSKCGENKIIQKKFFSCRLVLRKSFNF